MYHSIVRSLVRRAFDDLNRRKMSAVLGGRCLGGTRTTAESRARWYERLHALFPQFTFTLPSIEVSGTPWNTCVRVFWTDTARLVQALHRLAKSSNPHAQASPMQDS